MGSNLCSFIFVAFSCHAYRVSLTELPIPDPGLTGRCYFLGLPFNKAAIFDNFTQSAATRLPITFSNQLPNSSAAFSGGGE